MPALIANHLLLPANCPVKKIPPDIAAGEDIPKTDYIFRATAMKQRQNAGLAVSVFFF